ncbi:nuclear transport factor 2 family protein [Novosphingobium sp. BL-8A]|uniref:nuclear transport factor 2 family protein n=1 Tax=Novosphingobium sp. BL-8A TaxID=3127639 RepID=UPI0037565595
MRTEARHAGDLRPIADALIAATNTFDVEAALALFAADAVIDDPSTGERFDGQAGVREYIERFFVGYRTVTRLLSFTSTGERQARLRADFTGDFGHEIGLLEIVTDPAGLIVRIDADLE